MAVGSLQTRWHSAAKGAAGATAQPMQWLGEGQPVLAGTAVLVALLGEEQHTPLMQPWEENLALSTVLMPPATNHDY